MQAQITVHLVARADRDQLLGIRDGVLRARVAAPPVDGKANDALCRLIAKQVRTPPSNVNVIRGKKSRHKVVSVTGMDTAALKLKLSRSP